MLSPLHAKYRYYVMLYIQSDISGTVWRGGAHVRNSRSSSISSCTLFSETFVAITIVLSVPARIPNRMPPASSVRIENIFSTSVLGTLSPYPTVVSVVTA